MEQLFSELLIRHNAGDFLPSIVRSRWLLRCTVSSTEDEFSIIVFSRTIDDDDDDVTEDVE